MENRLAITAPVLLKSLRCFISGGEEASSSVDGVTDVKCCCVIIIIHAINGS